MALVFQSTLLTGNEPNGAQSEVIVAVVPALCFRGDDDGFQRMTGQCSSHDEKGTD